MQQFINKKVLVFGASGQIGSQVALAFAAHGANVAIHYNNSQQKKVAVLAKAVAAYSGSVFAVSADARSKSEIEEAIDRAVNFLGGLDIVVNCVGIFDWTPTEKMTVAIWDEMFDINVRSAFFMAKAARSFLKRSKCGSFISIADTYGLSPSGKFAAYGASKAALIALTKGLAKEFAPRVRVNCVCPGVVEPVGKLDAASKRAVAAALMQRTVPIADIVDAILLLAKSESVTGQAICVDGGKNV